MNMSCSERERADRCK